MTALHLISHQTNCTFAYQFVQTPIHPIHWSRLAWRRYVVTWFKLRFRDWTCHFDTPWPQQRTQKTETLAVECPKVRYKLFGTQINTHVSYAHPYIQRFRVVGYMNLRYDVPFLRENFPWNIVRYILSLNRRCKQTWACPNVIWHKETYHHPYHTICHQRFFILFY